MGRATQFLRGLWGTFWILIATLLVTAALLLALLRLILPGAGVFHDDLESWIEESIGVPIDIEELSLSLDGRVLEVGAHHVIVYDPATGEPQASFREGGIEIDLLSSIRFGEPVTTALSITHPKVTIIHYQDGSLGIEGGSEGEGVTAPFIGWLLAQPSLIVNDAEILVNEERLPGIQWYFRDVDLSLTSSGYRHQATGSVVLGQKDSEAVQVELEWFGDLLNPHGWDGQMFLQGRDVELVNLIGGQRSTWAPLAQGRANIRWWGEWLSGRLEKGRGTLDRDDRYLELSGLAGGEFFWKRAGDREWRLQAEQLVWGGEKESDRTSHPTSALVERRRGASGEDLLLGAVDRIQLVPTPDRAGLYATFFRGESGIHVSGTLNQLQFRSYPSSENLLNQVEARMETSGISIRGLKALDGYAVSGINGSLQANQQGGLFSPAAGAVTVEAEGIYRNPVAVDLQQGGVAWRNHAAGLLIATDAVKGAIGSLQVNGKAQLLMPASGGSPVLDLEARVNAGRVAELMGQLPEGKMNPRLVSWLKSGLLSGELADGRVLLRGPLDRFPYRQGGGEFRTELQIRDLYLNYANGWPAITNGQARLIFNNESLRLDMEEGKIDGHPLHDLYMVSDQVGKSPLSIHGQIVSESNSLLHSLENTPLRERGAQFNSLLSLQGYAFLDLEVEVPLKEGEQVAVDGRVELHENRLSLQELDLDIEQVQGNVEFGNEGFTVEGIRGEMMGGPVLITAFTAGDEQHELMVGLEGELLGERLEQWLGLGEGEDSYQLPLRVRGLNREDPKPGIQWGGRLKIELGDSQSRMIEGGHQFAGNRIELHLHSDLKGVEMVLPAPFNKPAEESWPTTLTMQLQSGELQRLHLSSPEHLLADLSRGSADSNSWNGLVLVGTVERPDPANQPLKGVSIQGALKRVSIGEWLGWYREISGGEGQPESMLPGTRLPEFNIQRIAVSAEEADLFGQPLQNLSVVMQPHKDGYWGVGVSSDQLQGRIEAPFERDKLLIVDLDHIRFDTDRKERPGEGLVSDIDPSYFPAMQMTSRKTNIKGIDFGRLQLQTHKSKNGLFFDDVTLESRVMKLTAQGSWLKRANASLSRFNIHAAGDELGEILSLFGYGGEIDQGATSVQIKAEWEGVPTDFSLGVMEGNMNLSVGKGQLRDVEQGVGRVFGLLGIHTLARRLTLDFSDVTGQGLPFDTIRGSFILKHGHAHTSDLAIDGPTATIKVDGRTGIVAQDYDQIISVSPKISETLPATGALVGGPAGAAVGGVVLLYQKLFRKEGIVTTRYALTGSWDEPRLEKIVKKRPIAPVTEPGHGMGLP